MRVLVTGHDGYIGPVMVRVLRDAGHDVTGLDTYFFRGCTFGVDDLQVPSLVKDIRDVTPSDLVGFEAVIHLAALSNDPMGDLKPEITSDINYRASVRLAECAKAAGVRRFLYSSSCSVYGDSNGQKIAEDGPVKPLTAYAVSKLRTEEEVSRMADASFSPVFLRNATAYGVSSRVRVDLVLNNLVAWAHTTGRIRLQSDGSPRRPLVHIGDIAATFAAVLEAPREAVHNEIFNVGTDTQNYRVGDLANIVARHVPDSAVELLPGAEPDHRNYWVDFSKLTRHLPGLTLRWDAERGARELYEAYREIGLQLHDLMDGERYVRVRRLTHLIRSEVVTSELRWQVA
jgi:nucleoside-diphosphate-sugar epimerase